MLLGSGSSSGLGNSTTIQAQEVACPANCQGGRDRHEGSDTIVAKIHGHPVGAHRYPVDKESHNARLLRLNNIIRVIAPLARITWSTVIIAGSIFGVAA